MLSIERVILLFGPAGNPRVNSTLQSHLHGGWVGIALVLHHKVMNLRLEVPMKRISYLK